MNDEPNEDWTSAICPKCRKRTQIVNPPKGDGTARIFIRHPTVSNQCAGSRTEVVL